MSFARPPFEVIRDPAVMRQRAEDLRRDGRTLAVVPTMGSLHDGHLALLRAARARADIVILTIFVNPTQFGPNEDLAKYPRDEAADLAKARHCRDSRDELVRSNNHDVPGCIDLAFCPDASAMYPDGAQTFVEVRELQKPMCGASRPGHFAGVATVVAALFHITRPHIAVFGEKDYQQLAIIRRMTRDLHFGIDIVSVPIVRDSDGLALSSRNAYLGPEQRRAARSVPQALAAGRACVAAGERDAAAIVAAAARVLDGEPLVRIDYIELRDAVDLGALHRLERPAVLAIAVFVGTTRLIDQTVVAP